MLNDLNFIVLWWLVLVLFSFVSLPLTVKIFKNFFDQGYAFSKVISWVLVTYVLFVLSVFKILPFGILSIVSLLILLGAVNLLLYLKDASVKTTIQHNLKKYIIFEIIFFSILLVWSYVRGFSPDIEGLEKFMDWGFVNSTLRSTYLPPVDMWYAGQPINYYYFGHIMYAVLTKLSGIDSTITYNLSIATAAALTFSVGLSLSANLVFLKSKNIKKSVFAGLISAYLLTFGGNLHVAYKIIKQDISQNNNKFVLTSDALKKAADSYWYPDATRFIGFDPDVQDKTIHEFPLYSFVVADLHGHLNDIPVVILIMSLLLSTLTTFSAKRNNFIEWGIVLPLGMLFSVAYMTNAWDFAVYGLVLGATFLFVSLHNFDPLKAFAKTIVNGLLTVALWYLCNLPFSLNFTPMVSGIKISDAKSPFYQLFILHGGWWIITIPFVLLFFVRLFKKRKQTNSLSNTDFFVLGIFCVATLMIVVPELIYLKDIYIYEHRRANTMFKLVYQAFIMYALISGYALTQLNTLKIKLFKYTYRVFFVLVFIIHSYYAYFAIKSYYNGLTDYKGLYGLTFLKNRYPDNYDIVNWIQKNISGQPAIVEAVGDSYTDYDQISMSTGLPTIQGWVVHEWLWRGGYDAPAARQTEVAKIYESLDRSEVENILKKYNIQYIFLGPKEKEKYPSLLVDKFDKWGYSVAYQSGQSKLYKVNK